MSPNDMVGRANRWLMAQPWRVWRDQTWTIFKAEAARILRRRYWVYLLAFIPVFIISGHAVLDGPRGTCRLDMDTTILAGIVQFYYLRVGIFIGGMAIFTWLFRGEMAEKSLHYYFLAPMRREVLVVGKYLAGVVATTLPFAVGVAASWFMMYIHFGTAGKAYMASSAGLSQLAAYLLVSMLAVIGYGAVFLALSLLVKNPVIPAAMVLAWEAVNTVFPAMLQRLSITYYLKSLLPVEVPAEGIFVLFTVVAEPVRPVAAVIGLLMLATAVLALACYWIRHTEIAYTSD